MEEAIIDVQMSSGQWQGLQTQPGYRVALPPCMLTHFPLLELFFCFGFLVTSISCNHYLTIMEYILWSGIVVGVEFEGLGPLEALVNSPKCQLPPPISLTHFRSSSIFAENQGHS